MLKKNPIQFSVVREDPEIEINLIQKFAVNKAVMIGSGGCTALSLLTRFPELDLNLIEPNPWQILLIKAKIRVLKNGDINNQYKSFGVGAMNADPSSLIEQGNFEALFRGFRRFIYEHIASKNEITRLMRTGSARAWRMIFQHAYWSVAFDLYFSDSLLSAMFGPTAIQHAPPASYPGYFRAVLQKGLLREDRSKNYFLHHIFLGHYLSEKSALPLYLQTPPPRLKIAFFQGRAQDFVDYSDFNFVGLSNIFDWSSRQEVRSLASRLRKELKPEALILYRQLNNKINYRSLFGDRFKWLNADAKQLHQHDRSLFYSSIHIGMKLK
ncbi:MAG: DUF3419 family protein [Gammaproteobacteria bacterium]|nr:DUF3419 family protein [Gammaproteobacteria bacterium]